MTEQTQTPTSEPPRRRTQPRPRRSGWRLLGRAVLALVGLVALAVAGVLVWIHTPPGERAVARIVSGQAKAAIAGDLRLGEIRIRGLLRVCVDGIDLRDPDGHQVLKAARACVAVQPLALRSKHVVLTEVMLEQPWLEIAKVPGTEETTLQRAIAARKKSAPKAPAPFEWTIDVRQLSLRGGSVTVRRQLGEEATFALVDLDLSDAHALYAADAAAAALKLAARLTAPGKMPVALQLDATLDGALPAGNLTLRTLRATLGESGLSLAGSWDLQQMSGALELRDLVLMPKDVAALAGKEVLAGAVRGSADFKSDGKTAQLALHLDGGGGAIAAKATATLEKKPVWDLQLTVDKLDPGALSPQAPRGTFTARASLHGKGRPQFDAHGVTGEMQGAIHVGPARLERVGPITADLDARLLGRYAIVKAFTASALGLTVKAHGAAAYDELSLDLDVRAPSLAEVGRAVGALQRKKSLPFAGSLRLLARVTGSPQRPDAEVHLRAPGLRWNPTVAVDGLAVDGTLHGPLRSPDGMLRITAQQLDAGNIDLGAPKVAMDLQWPVAHLRIDAGVRGGALQLAGDAEATPERDGLVLSNFLVSYPGNALKLQQPTRVHITRRIVVEPLELKSDSGDVRFEAMLEPPPGRMDVALVVSQFDLHRLPHFLLPRGLGLRGTVDLSAAVQGPRESPDYDATLALHGGGTRKAGELPVDARAHAHLHHGRIKSEGQVSSGSLLNVEWNADAPLQKLAEQPASAPLSLEVNVARLDLATLAEQAHLVTLQQKRVQGTVEARLSASGTLGAPHATLTIAATGLAAQQVKQVDAKAGLSLEKGKAQLDTTFSLDGEGALRLTGQTAFDLERALKDRAYLRGALQRPFTGEVAVNKLDLARLAKSGLLPEDSAGFVSLDAKLSGTVEKPQLQLATAGQEVSVGKIHGIAYEGQLGITDKLKLTLKAHTSGEIVATLDAGAQLSGAELIELARDHADPDQIAALLDRPVSFALDIPGLTFARVAQLAGKPLVAEGRLTGRVAFSGTPARPRLQGQLLLKDLAKGQSKLGGADVYFEAEQGGGVFHLGIDPPGGGSFLGHADLKADLGARALLRDGFDSILEGQLSGRVQAKHLDLAFLGGLIPYLRRAGGAVDADVSLSGLLSKPVAQGDAHLRRAMADIVGQGVFEDVSLDASFSPKEIVVDRLIGSLGNGTYSAVLVASRKASQDADTPDSVEFTGEVHLGDDESVRDRKTPDGKPMQAGMVPIRQAGEQRADIRGELDLFGDYTEGLLTVSAKIPDARVEITQLPDKKLPKLKPNPDVVLVHPGEKPHPPGMEPEEVEAEQKAIETATFRLHAHLDLQHLYVKAADFEFPVESSMNFDYDARHPDTPTADGTVHVPEGSFTALQRRFTVQDAKIVETGGDIADPELEVKALFENPQANVTITITGTAKDPQLQMSSDPPMDQDAIAFFIATGRIQGRATQQGGGVDLSGAATSVLGSLLFGEVRKELQSVLPVDVLTIETGSQGASEASVGKYIGDRIFVGYRQRLVPAPNENTEEGRIEYQISRSVSAEATVGDVNSDVSVLYTRDF
ncbi:MAG TPA: translocation/assembly module TamB domain-containing protein [Myxococcales bacterium]|nr:translocation/assembly module TamB domain-containing protein [Myxococcales bacterium]